MHDVNLSVPIHVPVSERGCGLGAVVSEPQAVSVMIDNSIRGNSFAELVEPHKGVNIP